MKKTLDFFRGYVKVFVGSMVVLVFSCGLTLADNPAVDSSGRPWISTAHVSVQKVVTIDAPVSAVWPHFLNFKEWSDSAKSYREVESGKPHTEGTVYRWKKTSRPFDVMTKMTKVIPEHLYAYEVLPHNADPEDYNDSTFISPYGDITYLFSEHLGKTRIVLNLVKVYRSSTWAQSDLDAWVEKKVQSQKSPESFEAFRRLEAIAKGSQ